MRCLPLAFDLPSLTASLMAFFITLPNGFGLSCALHPPVGFGALSLIDAMLDQPMSRVLDELPLSRDTRLALQGDPSPLRPVLEFVERYERGDWMSCSDLANRHGFVQEKVLERYREATVWAMQAFAA